MDWQRRDISLFDSDLDRLTFCPGNNTVFHYRRRGSNILKKECREFSDDELCRWSKKDDGRCHSSDGEQEIRIMIGNRAKEASRFSSGPGAESLTYIPLSRDTFLELVHRFYLSKSFVRTVLRGGLHFSTQILSHGSTSNSTQCFNMRMDNSWSRDLAMSCCANIHTGVTRAIFLGCDQNDVRVLTGWLKILTSMGHPVLLPALFAELQLRRHKTLIGNNWSKLVSLYAETGLYGDSNPARPYVATSKEDTKDYGRTTKHILQMHQDTGFLENSLRSCRRKLEQLISHATINDDVAPQSLKESTQAETTRIQARLQDMIIEYEEIEAKCKHITEGASILTAAVWSLVEQRENIINQSIQAATRRDSYAMKSLAVMSMIFLPGMAVAAVFETSLFNWQAQKAGDILSNRFWIYWAVVIPLTATILSIWSFWYFRSSSARPIYGPSVAEKSLIDGHAGKLLSIVGVRSKSPFRHEENGDPYYVSP